MPLRGAAKAASNAPHFSAPVRGGKCPPRNDQIARLTRPRRARIARAARSETEDSAFFRKTIFYCLHVSCSNLTACHWIFGLFDRSFVGPLWGRRRFPLHLVHGEAFQKDLTDEPSFQDPENLFAL